MHPYFFKKICANSMRFFVLAQKHRAGLAGINGDTLAYEYNKNNLETIIRKSIDKQRNREYTCIQVLI